TRSKRDWSSDVCSSDLQPLTCLPLHSPPALLGVQVLDDNIVVAIGSLQVHPPFHDVALSAHWLMRRIQREGQPNLTLIPPRRGVGAVNLAPGNSGAVPIIECSDEHRSPSKCLFRV